MTKRVQFKDIKQGKTFFHAHAFPHKNDNMQSYVEPVYITGRPFETSVCWFAPNSKYGTAFVKSDSFLRGFSLRDAGVIPNEYNFHRLFRTKKEAERYVERMKAGRLTAAERIKAERMAEHDRDMELWFPEYDYCDEMDY